MITYNGLKHSGKVYFLLFSKDKEEIQVPIDKLTYERISRYLEKFTSVTPFVEHLNDDPDEA